MKKIFTMAAIALFMMTSCSDDDSNNTNNPDSVVLLKKAIYEEDGETMTSTFTYNGTKLVTIVDSDGGVTTYTYTGDVITKSVYDDGDFYQEDIFTYYSDNTVKSHLRLEEFDYAEREEFTYNSDNTVTVNSFYGTHETQNPSGTSTIVMNNGNIVSTSQGTYTFDSKHNPFKNIAGYQALMFADQEGGVNNLLTADINAKSVYTYTYNAADYPTLQTETYTIDGQSTVSTMKYFYE